MSILVTRPDKAGNTLKNLLIAQQINAYWHPLIELVPSLTDPHQLNEKISQADAIIFISQQAVEHTSALLNKASLRWPTTPSYLAIGKSTADKLSQYSQANVIYPSVADSEHLLKLPELAALKHKKVLIVRGSKGRELIYDTLNKKGAKVDYLQVYSRKIIKFNTEKTFSLWKSLSIDTIIITSSEQLTILLNQLTKEQTNWLIRCRLIVPSERIRSDALNQGFHNVINANGADNQSLIQALLALKG